MPPRSGRETSARIDRSPKSPTPYLRFLIHGLQGWDSVCVQQIKRSHQHSVAVDVGAGRAVLDQ
eukprot:4292360-Prymnesium_polylepis.1